MFKKLCSVACILSLLLFNFHFAFAAPEINSDAVIYLKSQTPSPWTTMALVAAGEAGLSGDHLKASPGSSAISLTAPIMAIAALGEDPRTYPSSDFVTELKGYFDGAQIGDASTLNDDIFGILALIASGEPASSSEVSQTVSYLLSQQNTDGGWGFTVGGASDTNNTAGAIMALIAAGETSGGSAVQDALAYLQSVQNDDGGFPYDPVSPWGTDSDASSDAWVISALYAAGISPESWDKDGNNPVSHLNTLQTEGGFFQYQAGTGEDSFSPVTTSYAVTALAGKWYPVALYEGPITSSAPVVDYRIEGSTQTVCEGSVAAVSALDVVVNASEVCGLTYVIEDLSFGQYLSQINDDAAQGLIGWLYRVNWESPSVGAGDYILESGDSVLWYYGDFAWEPLRLSSSDTQLGSGSSLTLTVEAYGPSGWAGVDGATITAANGAEWTSGIDGSVTVTPDDGLYPLTASAEGYVRSNNVLVTVGDMSGHTVDVSVNVLGSSGDGGGGGGGVGGDADTVSFTVTPDAVDFGDLAKGSSAEAQLTISNTGTSDIHVEAVVSGDDLFEQELELEDVYWAGFSTDINSSEEDEVTASIRVPSNYTVTGDQNGSIIFWAIAN